MPRSVLTLPPTHPRLHAALPLPSTGSYFSQFVQTPFGMRRLDPQDAGPSYRNVVGLPGGVNSPLFQVLQEENVNKMELKEGKGNEFRGMFGGPTEDDLINVVWVVDSNKLPFYQAEVYHQYHNGIGKVCPGQTRHQCTSAAAVQKCGCAQGMHVTVIAVALQAIRGCIDFVPKVVLCSASMPHRTAPMLQAFPREYTRDLKNQMLSEGRIAPTGCPELPF